MKLKAANLIVIFLVLSSSFCLAQDIIKDVYSVGFKYYKTYDEARQYIIDNDTIYRPLLIHFWYPTIENIEKKTYHFKEYIDLISFRENFNKAQSDVDAYSFNFVNAYAGFAKQQFGLDTNTKTQQILDCPVFAQYGVDIAQNDKGFPLLIYAPSNSKSSVQNHLICEYLASHGYMVISVGSAGWESLKRSNDEESIMAQVLDMEYVLRYFEDNLKIKYDGLGLMGFSSGVLANIIFQMNNEKVNAVLSMDGSQEYGSYLPLFKSADFDLNRANVPYCFLVNNYKNFSIYPFYYSIVASDKYMFSMPYLDHNGFVSYWRFFDLCSSNPKGSKICTSYDYIESTALAFFNTYLKTSPTSESQVDLNIIANEYIKPETNDNALMAQVFNVILTNNINAGIQFLNENQEAFESKENDIIILSKMIKDHDMDASVQLMLFNTEIHPNSWKAFFELANVYNENKDLSLAKTAALRAQQLDPENSEINSLLKKIKEVDK